MSDLAIIPDHDTYYFQLANKCEASLLSHIKSYRSLALYIQAGSKIPICLSVGCPYFHPFRTRSLGCILLASDSMPVDDATWICVYQKRFISFKTPSCGRPRRAYTRYRKLEVYLGNPFRAHAIFSNSSPDRVEAFPLLVPILQVIICTIEISLIHTQLYFIFSPNLLGLGLTVISPSLFALH